MFRALQEGCGQLFGRVCPNELLNYCRPVKIGPVGERKMGANVWKFQLLRRAHRPLDFGVTGEVRAFVWAGFPRRVIELLGAGEKAGPFENENRVA